MKYATFTLVLALFATNLFASQNKAQVVVRIQAQSGNIDEAALYFDQGIVSTYASQEDAQKVYSGVAGVPVIYSLTSDQVDCSINGYGPVSATQVVELGYDVDVDGYYDISAPVLDNVDPTSIVRLEDRLLGTYTDLRMSKYNVYLQDTDPSTGRFFVHVSTPVQVAVTNAGCANNDGTLQVTQDNSVAWTACKLFDAFNNEVAGYNNITGQFNFNALGAGDYYMLYVFGNYSTTKTFRVTGHYVVANITASAVNVEVYEPITFHASASNSSIYSWDFGDGTLITGVANPTINYYEPGEYLVNLICANDFGCTDNAQMTITVTSATISGVNEQTKNNAKVFAAGRNITVSFNDVTPDNAKVQVYSLIGQSVYSSAINSQRETFSLNDQPAGYYLVSVKNAGAVTTKRVFLN